MIHAMRGWGRKPCVARGRRTADRVATELAPGSDVTSTQPIRKRRSGLGRRNILASRSHPPIDARRSRRRCGRGRGRGPRSSQSALLSCTSMAKRLAELWSCSIFSSVAPRRARACFQPCLAPRWCSALARGAAPGCCAARARETDAARDGVSCDVPACFMTVNTNGFVFAFARQRHQGQRFT